MKSFFYAAQSLAKPFLLLLLIACSTGMHAQTATLSVQGVLTKSDGTAVDDGNDYVLTFRLWKSESSTNPTDKVHQETIENISIVGGVYSVVLGLNPDPQLQLIAPFNQPYWLGVSVSTSNVELLPRPRLTHAPYALGLVGQHNIFPSTGPVIGDAFRANGGQPIGGQGQDGNGFSFKPGADETGGMFSREPNNVELWAGGQERMQLNTTQNEIYGTTVNFGPFISNNLTVNGNEQINGFSTITNGQTVNGVQTINSNQFVNGFSTVTANQTVNGIVRSGEGIVNKTFTSTGMYLNSVNHDIQFNVNGNGRFLMGDNGTNYIWGPTIFQNGNFNVIGLTFGDYKTMQYNDATGKFYWDNSSRRFKENITVLKDDFSLILKSQPKTYTRPGVPDRWEIGYIAEEMDSIGLKQLVEHNSSTGIIDGFNYEKMVLYVVEVLKLQDAAITQLQSEVAQLKSENAGLANLNTNLKTNNSELEKQQAGINKQLASLLKRMQALEASNTGK